MTALSNDDQNLYAADNQGRITIWKKSELSESQYIQSHSATYLQSLHTDSDYLYGGSIWEDCTIGIYDKKSLDVLETLDGAHGTIFCLVSDDSNLLSGSGDSKVVIRSKIDWSVVGSFKGQKHFVLSLAIDRDYIYAGGIDDCTNVFARDSLNQITSLEGHDSNVLSLAVDDDFLYSGSGEIWWGGPGSPRPPEFESSIRVWDKKDWSCISVLEGHSDNVNSIAIDNKYVYSISDDATLRIYSKSDWIEILCIQVPVMRIDALTMDKSSVYIGCSDGSVRQFLKARI
ncbi:MAG: WD40 repeat domain-containing protein [Candidatus Thorarchaeota archaeon]